MGAWTDPSEVRRALAHQVRAAKDGAWRSEQIQPTPAQARVLRALAAGDVLLIDPAGVVRVRAGGPVHPRVLRTITTQGWATAPAGPAPLFNEPAIDGRITELGRNILARGSK
jgi:hypothetical protein